MRNTRSLRLLLTALPLTLLAGGAARAQTSPGATRPTIVLVHGAFADALGWQRLIPSSREMDTT